jgi:uncharacterized protein
MDATEMDRVVDQHLQAEVAGDIAAILDTFANEVEHDLHPGASTGPMRTKADIEGFYTVLFCEVTINSIRNVRRWHGDTYLVDESVMSVTATGHPFGLDGQGRHAEIPALHVFEFAIRPPAHRQIRSMRAQSGLLCVHSENSTFIRRGARNELICASAMTAGNGRAYWGARV